LIFDETEVAGAYVIELEPITDERGFFARAWCAREFAERRLETQIAQCSISYNSRRGTLRGMHWQETPHEEVKLIRCVRGAIYDVVADLRPGSRTSGRWIAVELSAENRRLLYVPKGCAHGFQTLVDETEVFYAISMFYAPEAGRGFRYDDPAFAIEWPLTAEVVVSDRDRSWPDFDLSAAAAP
jgi:dTDP-4-dehydrorhamnose 3,5-epimerase